MKKKFKPLAPGEEVSPVIDAACRALKGSWKTLKDSSGGVRSQRYVAFGLHGLAAAILKAVNEGDEPALIPACIAFGRLIGIEEERRAAADRRKKHKEDAGKKRTDKDKPGGGEDAIIAAVMKRHGGRLPARLKRGDAKEVAADLGYRADYVSQTVTKRRKNES